MKAKNPRFKLLRGVTQKRREFSQRRKGRKKAVRPPNIFVRDAPSSAGFPLTSHVFTRLSSSVARPRRAIDSSQLNAHGVSVCVCVSVCWGGGSSGPSTPPAAVPVVQRRQCSPSWPRLLSPILRKFAECGSWLDEVSTVTAHHRLPFFF